MKNEEYPVVLVNVTKLRLRQLFVLNIRGVQEMVLTDGTEVHLSTEVDLTVIGNNPTVFMVVEGENIKIEEYVDFNELLTFVLSHGGVTIRKNWKPQGS